MQLHNLLLLWFNSNTSTRESSRPARGSSLRCARKSVRLVSRTSTSLPASSPRRKRWIFWIFWRICRNKFGYYPPGRCAAMSLFSCHSDVWTVEINVVRNARTPSAKSMHILKLCRAISGRARFKIVSVPITGALLLTSISRSGSEADSYDGTQARPLQPWNKEEGERVTATEGETI